MSELLSFMKHRRSNLTREMTGPGPSDSDIDEIVQIATRVPDHGKLSPWRVIHIDQEASELLGDIAAEIRALEGADERVQADDRARFTKTPTILAIVSSPIDHPKIPHWEQHLSAGAVCYGALIGAQALGYAAQWLTGWVAYDARITKQLGLSESEKIAGFIHIGRSDQLKVDRPRPELKDVLSRASALRTAN